MKPTVHLHRADLPDNVNFEHSVAVDTETMGLNLIRDRLCLVQLSQGDGVCHLVQIDDSIEPTNLKRVLANPDILKIFHYARFDIGSIYCGLDVIAAPLYCTKIASKLTRTYTDKHGLKDLCRSLLNVDISKEEQSSDWGSDQLSQSQMLYAATDVLYLHSLKEKLDILLAREGRVEIAQNCFDFVPTRVMLDLLSFEDPDIFRH